MSCRFRVQNTFSELWHDMTRLLHLCCVPVEIKGRGCALHAVFEHHCLVEAAIFHIVIVHDHQVAADCRTCQRVAKKSQVELCIGSFFLWPDLWFADSETRIIRWLVLKKNRECTIPARHQPIKFSFISSLCIHKNSFNSSKKKKNRKLIFFLPLLPWTLNYYPGEILVCWFQP